MAPPLGHGEKTMATGQKTRKQRQRTQLLSQLPLPLICHHPDEAAAIVSAHMSRDQTGKDIAYEHALRCYSTMLRPLLDNAGQYLIKSVDKMISLGTEIWIVNGYFLEQITSAQDGSTRRVGVTLFNNGRPVIFVSSQASPDVLFHELLHATGHYLGRWTTIPNIGRQSKEYLYEEATVEIAEGIICGLNDNTIHNETDIRNVTAAKFREVRILYAREIMRAFGTKQFVTYSSADKWVVDAMSAINFLIGDVFC